MSKGLKVFGDPRVAAALKYTKQLHFRMIMDPTNTSKMSNGQKKAALKNLILNNNKNTEI